MPENGVDMNWFDYEGKLFTPKDGPNGVWDPGPKGCSDSKSAGIIRLNRFGPKLDPRPNYGC